MSARGGLCVLASGGVESSVLVSEALRGGRVVWPLYIRCGFFWEDAELAGLKRVLSFLKHSRLKALSVARGDIRFLCGPHWAFHGRGVPDRRSDDRAVNLPARNLLLFAHAAVLCQERGLSEIRIGTLRGNPFADARREFFEKAGEVISLGIGRRVRIRAPFAGFHKADVIRRAPPGLLERTFSCIHPRGERPCGRCNKCHEKAKALKRSGAAGAPVR